MFLSRRVGSCLSFDEEDTKPSRREQSCPHSAVQYHAIHDIHVLLSRSRRLQSRASWLELVIELGGKFLEQSNVITLSLLEQVDISYVLYYAAASTART